MRIAAPIILTVVIIAAGIALALRFTGDAVPDEAPPSLELHPESTVLFWSDDLSSWMHWDANGGAGATESEVRDIAAGVDSEDNAPRWAISDGAMSAPIGTDGLTTLQSFGGYLLHVDFKIPDETGNQNQVLGALAGVELSGKYKISIADSHGQQPGPASSGAVGGTPPDLDAAAPAGQWQSMEIAFEEPEDEPAIVSVWLNGERVQQDLRIDAPAITAPNGPDRVGAFYSTDRNISIGADNTTVLVRFRAEGSGTIFSRAPAEGPWEPDAKAVFLRGGQLIYDIGWVGSINAGSGYDDGEWHTLAFVYRDSVIRLYIDGELKTTDDDFISEDNPEHVFKIGAASPDFAGNLQGNVSRLLTYDHALTEMEIQAFANGQDPSSQSTLDWTGSEHRSVEAVDFDSAGKIGPISLWSASPGLRFANVWIRPLPNVDHLELITQVSPEVIQRGQRLYEQVCMTCHGSPTIEGTLPTSRRFHDQPLEAGSDPYSMYKTLDQGYKQMLPQVWMSAQQKYDVIHYLRESLLRGYNEDQYFEITSDYLASLPRGLSTIASEEQGEGGPDDTYRRMDFGPSLNWTFEVAPDNIAYKGIAIRLDEGEDGISQGKSWVLYDHDTMRVAAMWQGEFVDWRGIAFDGSHQTHTKIAGDPVFMNPVGPGWARPGTSDFDDPRLLGRDDKPYGPLPRDWAHYKGLHKNGNNVVVSYSVGSTDILELPTLVDDGVMVRTLDISDPSETLRLRVAPTDVSVAISADPTLSLERMDGFHVLVIPADSGARTFQVFAADLPPDQLATAVQAAPPPTDIRPLLAGGAKRWPYILGVRGELDVAREWEGAITENAPYAVDSLFVPRDNPWNAWMRLGGFDFYPDGHRAVVCTWNGDVWLVSGLDDSLELLTWQRIATGLFQPLGLKIVDDAIYVGCRDQIVRLHDLNGDNEIDFFENFNNDHQVTEHFHEFAMGLDTDADGNFYYAKGARHAKRALVPQHGTLLKVSRDGSTTEIIASGFRAPNGICINDDGSFFITDQEGHWTPKNRINLVQPGKFYGNFWGYHDRTNSDSEMEQPVVWITNEFDRSPAELLWATSDRWGPVKGQLLAVSYGMGQVFVVPHETVKGQIQGGQTPLPLPLFPTGVMRGKFSPDDGQLYVAGMFAWAGNRVEPGGFYRVRYTGEEVVVSTGIHARQGALDLTFSAPLDESFVRDVSNYTIHAWDLKRSANYGSEHYNERSLAITAATLLPDTQTIRLTIPDLAPTWGMKCEFTVRSAAGTVVSSEIHNTIHALSESK